MIQSAVAHSTRATTGRTDATLLDLVRRDPVDIGALDELIDRYWRRLFARCQLLTQDAELAADLAQETWCRVLRARHDLKTEQTITTWLRHGIAELRVPLGAWAVPTA
jgi:DNA-directed RNA polymerase specialized sigma24 family protein